VWSCYSCHDMKMIPSFALGFHLVIECETTLIYKSKRERFGDKRLISLAGRHYDASRGSEFGCRYAIAVCRATCIWHIC
jgi:hypothetical protein